MPWRVRFWASLAVVVTSALAGAWSLWISPSSVPEFQFQAPPGWKDGGMDVIVDGARALGADTSAVRSAAKDTFFARRSIAPDQEAIIEARITNGTIVASESRIRAAAEASRDGLAKVGKVTTEIRDVEVVHVKGIDCGRFLLHAVIGDADVTSVTYVIPGRTTRATMSVTASTDQLDVLMEDFEAFVAAAPLTKPPAVVLPFSPVYVPLAVMAIEVVLELALARVPPPPAPPKRKRKKRRPTVDRANPPPSEAT